jgi:diguanylate cyclase (GGDEF)-like protein
MEVMLVHEPMEIMQALLDFNPELILMDVYMPGCTGLELAKVIRQNISYLNLPIVFLSSETDQEQQYAALRMGGDDFLVKPIQDDHLISSVITRVQRSRKLASAITRDSLTGLINHAKIREQLELEVLRAERQGSTLSFAMIDLDHFKNINDSYGHVVGDHVIREISRELKQQLRRTDIIGRYGGEEFAVILPDTAEKAAEYALDKIREEFAKKSHIFGDDSFSVSFSCGISGFPNHKRAEDIVTRADEALYKAKEKGRNCTVVADL